MKEAPSKLNRRGFKPRSVSIDREVVLDDMEDHTLKRACEALGLIALYLHGSHSDGSARADSDMDFAYLLPHGREAGPVEDVLLPLLSRVFECDESKVDLQNLRQAPPHFRVRVLERGRLLEVGNPTELARFHASSVSEDRDLERYLRPFREAMRQRIHQGRYAS